ncbi:MAG: HTH domain-containing protein [Tenuifilaceae bacterium]|jgi:predicted DNA-binding transcriptional regulator YafY|nr:HTH domain-containing protein [Tenuifilaceae bacterium]
MQFNNLFENLRQVASLIESESTGTPHDLATRIGVTDRTIRNYVKMLREMGGDIAYSVRLQTYYLRTPATFRLGFEPVTGYAIPKKNHLTKQ